ncbi:MAG: TerB family tellurite resistance protein [Ignavibacteria bacterium]|nr:TerB family tellurite resistance protein [Ignavibacteria bacterium]
MSINHYAKLKNLGYLYLAFAHLSDTVLSEEETEEIKRILSKRSEGTDLKEISSLWDDIVGWYNKSADQRIQVVYSIAAKLNVDLETDIEKGAILDDLLSIANADQDLADNEKSFIRSLAEAWGIDFSL